MSRFLAPNGQKFWSFGVCVVDRGATATPTNPGYDASQHYSTAQAWAQEVTGNLSRWGFNTIGAWSDFAELSQVNVPELKFMPVLHMGSTAGAPWRDMWDPRVVEQMRDLARTGIAPVKGDSRVVGYFSDNEMGWWLGALWDWAWKAGPACRAQVIQLLQRRYRDSWTELNRDFEAVGADDFDSLSTAGRLYLRPGSSGMATLQAWQGIVADRYYFLCRKFIKSEDPGALFLGDRYISNFYPVVARASAKYVDVCSTNLNSDWNDGGLSPFYMKALRRITRKPILVSEYYMSATENRSGNKNDSSGFPVVATQAQRAAQFSELTRTLLSTPFVIGAHWFQYYDEPQNGRPDGENYNMGLVDVCNKPYEELTKAAALTPSYLAPQPTEKEAPQIPALTPAQSHDFNQWPHTKCVLKGNANNARGDVYLAQSEKKLFLAVYWNEDRFAEALYRHGAIPDSDEAQLTLSLNGKLRKIRLTEAIPPIYPGIRLIQSVSGVRNLRLFELDRTPNRRSELDIAAKLESRARAFRMSWRSTIELN